MNQDLMNRIQAMMQQRGASGNGIMGYASGGGVPRETTIGGQPHMLAYINPEEEQMLYAAGGSGEPGPGGIPAFVPSNPGDRSTAGTASYNNFQNMVQQQNRGYSDNNSPAELAYLARGRAAQQATANQQAEANMAAEAQRVEDQRIADVNAAAVAQQEQDIADAQARTEAEAEAQRVAIEAQAEAQRAEAQRVETQRIEAQRIETQRIADEQAESQRIQALVNDSIATTNQAPAIPVIGQDIDLDPYDPTFGDPRGNQLNPPVAEAGFPSAPVVDPVVDPVVNPAEAFRENERRRANASGANIVNPFDDPEDEEVNRALNASELAMGELLGTNTVQAAINLSASDGSATSPRDITDLAMGESSGEYLRRMAEERDAFDGAASPTELQNIKNRVHVVEGTDDEGGYDRLLGGQENNFGVKPTEMTVQEVLDFQSKRGPNTYARYSQDVNEGRNFLREDGAGQISTPVGKYQVVGSNLKEMIALGIVDPDAKFNAETQEKIGDYLITQKRGYDDYVNGNITLAQFEKGLGNEFEGIAIQGLGPISVNEIDQKIADASGESTSDGVQVASASADDAFRLGLGMENLNSLVTPASAVTDDLELEVLVPTDSNDSGNNRIMQASSLADFRGEGADSLSGLDEFATNLDENILSGTAEKPLTQEAIDNFLDKTRLDFSSDNPSSLSSISEASDAARDYYTTGAGADGATQPMYSKEKTAEIFDRASSGGGDITDQERATIYGDNSRSITDITDEEREAYFDLLVDGYADQMEVEEIPTEAEISGTPTELTPAQRLAAVRALKTKNTAREDLANLITPGDGAEYINGQLVDSLTGESLEGGGYTIDPETGEKDYIYGVSDDFTNNTDVDTTGMSERDAIVAKAKQQMVRDIPPNDLAYFASFVPGIISPIGDFGLGEKMLSGGIEERRAMIEKEIAALKGGAEPRYDDDGNYIGHATPYTRTQKFLGTDPESDSYSGNTYGNAKNKNTFVDPYASTAVPDSNPQTQDEIDYLLAQAVGTATAGGERKGPVGKIGVRKIKPRVSVPVRPEKTGDSGGVTFRTPKQFAQGGSVTPNIDSFFSNLR